MLKRALPILLSTFCFSASADEGNLVVTIQKNLADRATVRSVSKSEVEGIYKVDIGRKIIYSDRSGRYLFVGNLMDSQTNTNLTDLENRRLISERIKNISFENSLTFKKGLGKRSLIVFEDPQCPYCKKLEENLDHIENVTVHVFIIPILGPESRRLGKSIMCSPNPAETWHLHMLSNTTPADGNCETKYESSNLSLASSFGVTATPTIISENGKEGFGYQTSEQLESIIAP